MTEQLRTGSSSRPHAPLSNFFYGSVYQGCVFALFQLFCIVDKFLCNRADFSVLHCVTA